MRFWPWKKSPKLIYDHGTHQVSVALDRNLCLSGQKAQTKLLKQAEALLASQKASGDIQDWIIYSDLFNSVWQTMAAMNDEEKAFSVNCVIAAGIPRMEGVQVYLAKSKNEDVKLKTLVYLTIEAPRPVIAGWRVEWLEALISSKLAGAGIKDRTHRAQLECALLRAANGESTDKVPLMRAPRQKQPPEGDIHKTSFSIVANHTRKELYLYVDNPWFLRKAHADQQVLSALEVAAEKFRQTRGTDYKVRRKMVTDAMQKARAGIEGIGIDLPLVILGASTLRLGEITRANGYPGQGRLFIDIAADKMIARIARFNMDIYQDESFSPDRAWITRELERLGCASGTSNELLASLAEKLAQKESLDGMEAASGLPPTGGKDPYLFLTYQASPLSLSTGETNQSVNMREIQQRSLVRTGQVIAEVKFKNPGAPGRNIFGEVIPQLADEPLDVKIGEGIDAVNGVFKAQYDGAPAVDGNSITLVKAYVVNGDVDMRTGNIRFDGPVEVKGSIESNAVVECTGPLIVAGSLMGAKVHCKTTISVQGSITMGGQGKVIAKESIHAEFIENATLQCKGDIKANKAILNSEVISGKSVETVEGTGIIAGGTIISRESIRCGNLGFKNGARTEVNCGGDFKAELGVKIRKKRLDRLTQLQEDVKNTLKELNSKSPSQMTERHEEMRKTALKQQGKLKDLLERAQTALRTAQGKITYDDSAKVYIQNLLTTNCRVQVAGKVIPIETDMLACVIQSKPRRGNFIIAINEVDAPEGAADGTSPQAEKKAS